MAQNLRGVHGKVLRVDIGKSNVWIESVDESTLRKYVGGTGLGVKYLYDEVDPKIKWSDPSNILFVGSGPLGGTSVPGSGTISIVTKGAMTNGAAATQANGFFGTYLKFSGFDAVVITGAATDWRYLYIHDGKAELRDASHLKGQNTWETEDAIKKELGQNERDMSVFSIGPAGENMVKFAAIVGDKGHVAAHNGVGAVMGSKKLKAIAVKRSAKKMAVHDEEALRTINKKLIDSAKQFLGGLLYNWGTSRLFPVALSSGILPVRNYTTNVFPEAENFDGEVIRKKYEVKRRPCYACPSKHVELMTAPDGPYAGYSGEEPEYEQWAAFGSQIGVTDPSAAFMLANEGDRLGMDANELGWIIGWVMECYEKDLLTEDDLDGLEMTWGNAEATRTLLYNIAERKGYGDILAEGVKYAAEQLGGEASHMAIFTGKCNTPRGHDHRGKWVEMLDTAVSNTGSMEAQPLVKNPVIWGMPQPFNPFSPEQVADAAAKEKPSLPFSDSLVTCYLITLNDVELLTEAVNSATGWNMTVEEAKKVGLRAVNMMRVFNSRAGHTPDQETLSLRYGSTPKDGPAEGKSIIPHWDAMVDKYYQLMGWDRKTGLPYPETLKDLDLEELIDTFKRS
jgi:aldehyde:ferredoxin oxidoreductase